MWSNQGLTKQLKDETERKKKEILVKTIININYKIFKII